MQRWSQGSKTPSPIATRPCVPSETISLAGERRGREECGRRETLIQREPNLFNVHNYTHAQTVSPRLFLLPLPSMEREPVTLFALELKLYMFGHTFFQCLLVVHFCGSLPFHAEGR
ncbi:hypothetical protein GBAR_LOCUS20383, partial [Geodia barretti]